MRKSDIIYFIIFIFIFTFVFNCILLYKTGVYRRTDVINHYSSLKSRLKRHKKEYDLKVFQSSSKVYRKNVMLKNSSKLDIEKFHSLRLYKKYSPSFEIPIVLILCLESKENLKYQSDDVNQHLSDDRQRDQILSFFGTLLYFSKFEMWRIIIVTDKLEGFNFITGLISKWPKSYQLRLSLQYRPLILPKIAQKYRNQWRPCAWSKQFLPQLLSDLDSVVYFDTDTLFLGPAEEVWQVWQNMNRSHALALGSDAMYITQDPDRPRAGRVGLNSGVMLMNLTKLRNFKNKTFGQKLLEINLNPPVRHDQDALNAFLKYNQNIFIEFSQRYNFYGGSCLSKAPSCPKCTSHGIIVLHGADATFYRNLIPKIKVYKLIYTVFFKINSLL